MKQIKLDHVERLSRGKRSGLKIGSRAVGHYLRPHERAAYQRALKKGYLDITEKDRVNLWHIWEKACLALQWRFLVLIKDTNQGIGTVYQDNELIISTELSQSKREIKFLSSSRAELSEKLLDDSSSMPDKLSSNALVD